MLSAKQRAMIGLTSKLTPKPEPMKLDTKQKNNVRIIGGDLRSRKINFPSANGLRPTSDRVRETLFNWLQFDIAGSYCLDLFAGSGALGFECLSRGASSVTFIEVNKVAANAIKENLQTLDQFNGNIVCGNALDWLRQANVNSKKFNIVFLDPPFAMDTISETSKYLVDNQWLDIGCKIYIESDSEIDSSMIPSQWREIKKKKAGQVHFKLYSNETEHKI